MTLIDGERGFDRWDRVGAANWRVADGVVQADSGEKGKASFLLTRRPYGDFQLRVEFWASPDANSGIYMRCADVSNLTDRTCYEADIFDQRPDPNYGTGSIVHHSSIKDMPKAGGRWNVYEITARGNTITVALNGVRTARTDKATVASGPIALQWAAGTIRFRKVELRPI